MSKNELSSRMRAVFNDTLYSRLPSTQFNKCTFCITLTNRAFSKCEFECD